MMISLENAKRLKELGIKGEGYIPNIYATYEDAQSLRNPIPQLSPSQLLPRLGEDDDLGEIIVDILKNRHGTLRHIDMRMDLRCLRIEEE
jgi:hypothetical protein